MSHNQSQGSPLPSSSPSVIKRNRRNMVLVDGAFTKLRHSGVNSEAGSPPDSPTSSHPTGELKSLSPPSVVTSSRSESKRPKSGPSFLHQSLNPSISSNSDPQSTSSNRPRSTSPLPSNRSSISSQSESLSSMSTVQLPIQGTLLQDIRQQMVTSLNRMRKLEDKVKKIPDLKQAIKQLRSVNCDLQAQLKLEIEREETLKQQVEKLQADNLQLATSSSAIANESDLHVIRHTLVTSINHFKQLEEDNKLIPVLKDKINQLEKELTNNNSRHSSSEPTAEQPHPAPRLKQVEAELKRLNHMMLTLRDKLEQFEKDDNNTAEDMKRQISQLEKENSTLSGEIAKLKSSSDRMDDCNFSDNLLMKENISLRNTVLRLKDKLVQAEGDARRQREQLTLKLFDVEAINVEACACAIEEQMKAAGHNSGTEPPSGQAETEVKKQQLRIHQLEIQGKQSQQLIQTLLTQRVELERRITQLLQEKKSDSVAMDTSKDNVSMMESIVMELEGTHSEALLSSGVITRPTIEHEKIQSRMKELEDGLTRAKAALKDVEDSKKLKRELQSTQKEHDKLKKKLEEVEQNLATKDGEVLQLKEIAVKYDTLSNEYCQLVENYDKAKQQIERSETELKQYKEDFENASTEVTNLGEQVQETEVKLSDLQATYDDLCSEKDQLEEELATLKVDHESEIAVAQERLVAMETEKESLSSQVNKLREKIVVLSDEISTLLCEKRAVERKLDTVSAESPALLQENIELKFRKEKLEDELKESNKKVIKLQGELDVTKEQVIKMRIDETKYHNQLSEWNVTMTTWEEEKKTINKEKELLKEELEEKSTSLSQISAEVTKSTSECNRLTLQLEETKKELQLLQVQASTRQEQLDGLATEKEKLHSTARSEIQQLSQQVKTITDQLEMSETAKAQTQLKFDEVTDKVTALQQDYDSKCKELEEARKSSKLSCEQLNLKISQAQRETTEAKQLSQLLQQQIQDFQRDHTSLQSDKKVSMETIHELEQKLHNKSCKIAELEDTLNTTSTSLQARIDNIEQEKESVKEKCGKLEEQLHEAKEQHSIVSASLKEAEQLHCNEKEHSETLAVDLKCAREELEGLQKEHTRILDELTRLSTNEKTVQEQLVAAQFAAVYKETTMTSLQEELSLSSSKCTELQCQLTVVEEKCSSLELEKSVGSKQIEELQSQLDAKDKEWSVAKETLEAKVREVEQSLTAKESSQKEVTLKCEDLEKKLALTTASFTSELTALKQERDSCASKVIDIESDLSLTKLRNDKMSKELDSLKSDSSLLSEKLKTAKEQTASLNKEVTDLKEKLQVSQDEFLATQTSRDRLMERYENLEMEYEELKHRVQLELGQSTQLKADNKELFRLLQSAQGEMPSIQNQATRTIQEENEKLEKEISVLSQWNDKQRQELEALEKKLSQVTDQKQQILVELLKKENYEQENKQLKKELHEVEREVSVLKSKTDSEELSMKLQAQLQLVAVFNEHNKSLQDQVQQLQDQVISLGGQLNRVGPVEASVDIILEQQGGGAAHIKEQLGGGATPSKGGRKKRLGSGNKSNRSNKTVTSATTNGQTSDVTMEISTLLNENEMLKKKLTSLEAHLSSNNNKDNMKKHSPVLRQPSVMFALSSVRNMENGTPEDSVPTELLLPCSLLADALSSKKDITSPNMQQHLSAVKSSWFSCVAQRKATATQVESYLTTFHRLSPELLNLVVNSADEEGNTGLHHAVSAGNHGVMNILMGCEGLDTNCRNQAGYTPTMLASVTKVESDVHKDTLKRLLRKSDVNVMGKDCQTALMLSACTGDHVMLELLLDANADPNAQDMDGSTALMCACEHGNLEVARLLINHATCDITLKDNDGMTAMEIAKEADNVDIVALLQSYLHKTT